ncbi:MAG: hypothetical protein C0404_05245 [Verrucomicrobia bacterium]|nr:hypothetical protein [Verrucomicrobiota bacterium]
MKTVHRIVLTAILFAALPAFAQKTEIQKPYRAPCVERENVFEFAERPAVRLLGKDRYEITFASKANCDATVAIVDTENRIVRHLAAGVLGANAPAPLQKNSQKQAVAWDGKDDLGEYARDPGKLRVRVTLGLKPVFDKRIAGESPYNIAGAIFGISCDSEGVYIMSKGRRGRLLVRKFGHDIKYASSLVPPPANIPEEKLKGMGYVEYEPGKKAIHNRGLYSTCGDHGHYASMDGKRPRYCQPAMSGGRLFYLNSAIPGGSILYYISNDGSTDTRGCAGRPFATKVASHARPHLAASPDGKWVYMSDDGDNDSRIAGSCIWRCSTADSEPAKAFAGEFRKPGSDNTHLNGNTGIDCDGQGRVYVCDTSNRRVQVFDPEGKHLATLSANKPQLILVHRKTGEIYLYHGAMVEGKTTPRFTKYSPFPEFKEIHHTDGIDATCVALDSWAAKPTIWTGGGNKPGMDPRGLDTEISVRVWEDNGKGLVKVFDFEEEAVKEAAGNYVGRWSGLIGDRVVCDPYRERLYLKNSAVFDLKTGKLLHTFRIPVSTDDIAFDKRGYLHAHFNPCFGIQGAARYDPDRGWNPGDRGVLYPEVPYDYGEERPGIRGVLPLKDQGGPHGFQMGIGANMRGDIVVESCIYYVPKLDDYAKEQAVAGVKQGRGIFDLGMESHTEEKYANMLRGLQDGEKRGESIYSVPREPGVPLSGATAWTYDASGKLKKDCAVVGGSGINGVTIDEDGEVYFVTNRPRMEDPEHPFMYGRGGTFGEPGQPENGFTGTLIKTRNGACKIIAADAPIPLDADRFPKRMPDLMTISFVNVTGKGQWCWAEGTEWMYAGASPIVQGSACKCPQMRHHTDWFKRTYVPEAYRHSIGVVDSAGNLIMHIGSYGNFDSGSGPASRIRVGGDEIGMCFNETVSGTDNYLAFDDHGERVVVLRLDYHAEQTAPVPAQ